MRLVRDLLTEVGCTDVKVAKTPRGHYPIRFTLSYKPSADLATLFQAVQEAVHKEVQAAVPPKVK